MPKNIHLIADQYTPAQVEQARRFLQALDSPAPEAAIALDIVSKVENYLVSMSVSQPMLPMEIDNTPPGQGRLL